MTHRSGNADHLHCVNTAATARGLKTGMALADARAICTDLATRTADLAAEKAALASLRRWAGRYALMVGTDGIDGLIADISGVPHLFGGEQALREDLQARLERAGLAAISAIAGTRGAAHALSRHGGGIVADGRLAEGIGHLPVTALRVDHGTAEALARMGLARIADLILQPRAPLARRFGPGLVLRLSGAWRADGTCSGGARCATFRGANDPPGAYWQARGCHGGACPLARSAMCQTRTAPYGRASDAVGNATGGSRQRCG